MSTTSKKSKTAPLEVVITPAFPIPKVWNWINALARNTQGITTTQQSETLPNQTMSMEELVDRFVKGHEIPGLKNYPYDTELDMETPDTGMMTKTQIAQYKLDIKNQIEENEAKLISTRERIAAQKEHLKKTAKAEKDAPTESPQKTEK